ncbi:MAG: glycosyltransferase family 9 protein [Planctomycetaceae bacterium]|nr:glycosyltransferase family 9 protein [Planctomycetaceae bacterium]
MNILILNHHHIGDAICATSLVLGIRARWPDAHIAMFVRNKSICDLFPPGVIDQYHFYPSSKWQVPRLMRELCTPKLDLLVCTTELSHTWFVTALTWYSGARQIVAEDTIRYAPSRTIRVPFRYELHKFDSNREIGRAIDVELSADRPLVYVDPAAVEQSLAMLPAPGEDDWDQQRIAIAPGCHSLPHKAWPPERFAALVDQLLDAGWGRPVLFGSPQEVGLGQAIMAQLKSPHRERCLSVVGKLSLAQCSAALSRCQLLVSNDSGLAHMASGLSVPVVAMFGPTAARRCGPYRADAIVDRQLSCAPCYPQRHHGCGNPVCMTELPVAAVTSAIERVRNQSATITTAPKAAAAS